jgi:hypothetical protein
MRALGGCKITGRRSERERKVPGPLANHARGWYANYFLKSRNEGFPLQAGASTRQHEINHVRGF